MLTRNHTIKSSALVGGCAAIALLTGSATSSVAQGERAVSDKTASSSDAAPIYGIKIPAGYRDWQLIAVDQLLIEGKTDQLRAQLGNDVAIKAFKEGTIPFPDGSIIAAIHWTRVPSEENNKVLNGPFPG